MIAYDRGGARDTVVQGKTGLLFKEQTSEVLAAAVRSFEDQRLYDVDVSAVVAHAAQFTEAAFREGIARLLPPELAPVPTVTAAPVPDPQWSSS